MATVAKVLAYVMWCFEKCIKFLNKNAYIQTALMGNYNSLTRFKCSFGFTRFECIFTFTRFECTFIFTRFECSF